MITATTTRRMQYYPIQKNWGRRIKPHLVDPEFNRILVMDFNKFTYGRWREEFKPGMLPEQFESCDWRICRDDGRRGPDPEYWRYVKHSACHWLVNPALRLAMLSVPNREWRIVTSQKHSTVWDGDRTLFDLQFSALGVKPDEAFESARNYRGKVLPPGAYLEVYMADHYSKEK
jgi:hypothetical protein